MFQKLKYHCDLNEKKQFSAVQFPVMENLSHYQQSRGLGDKDIEIGRQTYRDNGYVPFTVLFWEPTFGCGLTEC